MSHLGPDPAHGGLTEHRGDVESCPGPDCGPAPGHRGTTNGNARGSSEDRRRRREYLVVTYRANQDARVIRGTFSTDPPIVTGAMALGQGEPACRCYRCGALLTVETVTVDRIIPGCRGGTYRRSNIRPACGPCNSETGGFTRSRS